MNKQDTIGIMSLIQTVYPDFGKNVNQNRTGDVVAVWTSIFADYPAAEVAVAVKSFISTDTKGFPPKPGMIVDIIHKNRQRGSDLSEMEAWSLVERAVSRSGWYAREEFSKLPKAVQDVVGSPEQLHAWSLLNHNELQTIIASNFQRSFRGKLTAIREYQALPDDVKAHIAEIADGMKVPKLPDK